MTYVIKAWRCVSGVLCRSIPNFLTRTLAGFAVKVDRLTSSLNGIKDGKIPVYDILNAGPRHRFACTDVVVSNCVAADLGMGMDKNLMLVKRFGLPVVQMMYTRQNKLFGKNKSGGASNRVSCWTIDKVMALDVLFMAIRNGRIFFPKTGLESFTPDLLSPYETTTEAGGMEHRLYLRSEGQPDDFCHALCFSSMVAMKLMGMDVDDMIPETAFGRGITHGRPEGFGVNPNEE